MATKLQQNFLLTKLGAAVGIGLLLNPPLLANENLYQWDERVIQRQLIALYNRNANVPSPEQIPEQAPIEYDSLLLQQLLSLSPDRAPQNIDSVEQTDNIFELDSSDEVVIDNQVVTNITPEISEVVVPQETFEEEPELSLELDEEIVTKDDIPEPFEDEIEMEDLALLEEDFDIEPQDNELEVDDDEEDDEEEFDEEEDDEEEEEEEEEEEDDEEEFDEEEFEEEEFEEEEFEEEEFEEEEFEEEEFEEEEFEEEEFEEEEFEEEEFEEEEDDEEEDEEEDEPPRT